METRLHRTAIGFRAAKPIAVKTPIDAALATSAARQLTKNRFLFKRFFFSFIRFVYLSQQQEQLYKLLWNWVLTKVC